LILCPDDGRIGCHQKNRQSGYAKFLNLVVWEGGCVHQLKEHPKRKKVSDYFKPDFVSQGKLHKTRLNRITF
jgi:hypothetical protein